MVNKRSTIYIAGHIGLVGSAIVRKLKEKGYKNLVTKTRRDLDLLDQKKVFQFIKKIKPNFIFLAAAKVGGIHHNNIKRAEFIYENLTIQNNIIHSAYKCGVKDIIFLGSSCVYPRNCKQPIKEEYLLSGKLEDTNEPYAIAKIAGIKMCENYNLQYKTNYKCLMPTNTFGPNDNYHKVNSHFFPALIRKIDDIRKNNKKTLIIWGDGSAKREIIYVDDLADACVYFMNKKIRETVINIGSGKEYRVKDYAKKYLEILLPNKKIIIKYDKTKPNGTPRKILDISLAKKYGWTAKANLKEAIIATYKDFLLK